MWIALAFTSALLMGFYETTKKHALRGNAVLPVLLLTVSFSCMFLLPCLIASVTGAHWFDGTLFQLPRLGWQAHSLVLGKAALLLAAWICGYFSLKHLPLTLAAPIDAMRPVPTLLGALILFGERPSPLQWAGIACIVGALWQLSRSGRKEGIRFSSNPWIWLLGLGAVFQVASGLYDKFLMNRLDALFVQGWYSFYQVCMMSVLVGLLYAARKEKHTPFIWRWSIPVTALLFSLAEFAYLYALHRPEAMISIVSTIRRGSVVVSFICGAVLLKEKNIRSKAAGLLLIVAGLLLLWAGSH